MTEITMIDRKENTYQTFSIASISHIETGYANDLLPPDDIAGNGLSGYDTLTRINFLNGDTCTYDAKWSMIFR